MPGDDLNTCVGCGLCLPHCPTFRVSGEEALSPRGRIAVMRQIEGAPIDREAASILNSCIQCRGCEPACPSGVPYGRLIEEAKSRLATDPASRSITVPFPVRLGLRLLDRPVALGAGSRLLAVARRLRLVPRRLDPGPIPIRNGSRLRSRTSSPDVWIFTGCVMDAWQRHTHRSLARILDHLGVTYGVTRGTCCGALHAHAGLDSRALADATIASMPGDEPILVDSAGCGAAMKDFGHLLGTLEAQQFAARVVDVHEWLAPRIDRLPRPDERTRVVVQDPCHLRHVQRVHGSVRTCLEPFADLIELDDDGLCCGAGGAYSILQPDIARVVRSRKIDNIEAVGGARAIVVSANPGCSQHLAAAGLDVRHPIDLIATTLVGRRS